MFHINLGFCILMSSIGFMNFYFVFVILRTSEIHLFYNLQLFYWHFLEILWLFIFLVFYYSFLLFLLSGPSLSFIKIPWQSMVNHSWL